METLQDILKLQLLISLPQLFIYNLFILILLNPLPKNLFKRLALFTVGHSVCTDLAVFFIPHHWHMLNSFLAHTILLCMIFRDLGKKRLFFIFVASNVFSLFMDLILALFLFYIIGVPDRETMIKEDLPLTMAVLYPQLLLTLIASWFIRKRNIFSAKRFFSLVAEGNRSALSSILLLIILQFGLMAILLFVQISNDHNKPEVTAILIYLIIAVSLFALVVILRLIIKSRDQAVRMTQEVYVEDINDMFTSIRGQRHDFLNHVQVIHTMAQMGKIDQLKTYVSDIVKETREVSDIVHHASPALAAFVQAKMTIAIGRGISFTYELPQQWYISDTAVKIIDVIKIIGNLVDNAFDESMLLPAGQRQVHASIRVENSEILLEVTNQGRVLSDEEKGKIFQPGYSTKGKGHSGLGLAIVTERVKYYRGQLTLESTAQSGTVFRARLPHSAVKSV